MRKPGCPGDETARLATLRSLNILDTPPEERFDRLARLAKRMFSLPIATVTLVDANRQWFKASVGLPNRETHRDLAFCAYTILGDEILEIEDTHRDEQFLDHPLVVGEPYIRFYAGCPITVHGKNVGSFCLIDRVPRTLSPEDRELLKDLASMAEKELLAEHLFSTDELTRLTNRRGLESFARQALAACRRMRKPATLVYFDLNDFKEINDGFGHAEGDRTLNIFANALVSVFRESDVIARVGGDEFAVLQVGSALSTAGEAIGRLRQYVSAACACEGRGYAVHFSTGQIEFDPARHRSVEDLLAEADAAMYANKAEWRRSKLAPV
jgi:diguanylate cyclase (GGDEF)-like protein